MLGAKVFLSLVLSIGANASLTVWSNSQSVNGTQENEEFFLGLYAAVGFLQCKPSTLFLSVRI